MKCPNFQKSKHFKKMFSWPSQHLQLLLKHRGVQVTTEDDGLGIEMSPCFHILLL